MVAVIHQVVSRTWVNQHAAPGTMLDQPSHHWLQLHGKKGNLEHRNRMRANGNGMEPADRHGVAEAVTHLLLDSRALYGIRCGEIDVRVIAGDDHEFLSYSRTRNRRRTPTTSPSLRGRTALAPSTACRGMAAA